MFERRNRPSMQKSLFDAFETKTPEQELTEQILKGGIQSLHPHRGIHLSLYQLEF